MATNFEMTLIGRTARLFALIIFLALPTVRADESCQQLITSAEGVNFAKEWVAETQIPFDKLKVDRSIILQALDAAFRDPNKDAITRYRRYVDETRLNLREFKFLPNKDAPNRLIAFFYDVQNLVRNLSTSNKRYAIVLYGSVINARSHSRSDLDYAIFEMSLVGSRIWLPSIRNPAEQLNALAQQQLGFSPKVTAPSDDPPLIPELRYFVLSKESTMVFISPDEVIWQTPRGDLTL